MRNDARIPGVALRTERAAERGGEAGCTSEPSIDRSLIDHLLADAGETSGHLGSAVVRAATLAAAVHRSMIGEVSR
ncbi:MAG: hypothetical protein MK085_02385 [Phycisphaerales bacterium]|nr:hypothetical protein [Phycisphaerales bacterium]